MDIAPPPERQSPYSLVFETHDLHHYHSIHPQSLQIVPLDAALALALAKLAPSVVVVVPLPVRNSSKQSP